MRDKIFDASVLINVLYECDYPEIFRAWANSGKYNLLVPHRVGLEIKHPQITRIFRQLIDRGIFRELEEIPEKEVNTLHNKYPKLSPADCEVLFYGLKTPNAICLTDEGPLSYYLRKKKVRRAGTRGVYNKICKDQEFPKAEIDQRFRTILRDKNKSKYK